MVLTCLGCWWAGLAVGAAVSDERFPHRENCLMEPQTTCPASMTWRTPTPVCPGRRSRRQKVACTRVTYVTRHSRRAVPCCDTNMSTQVGKDWGSCSVLHSLSWVHLCRCWGFQNTLLPFSDFLKKNFSWWLLLGEGQLGVMGWMLVGDVAIIISLLKCDRPWDSETAATWSTQSLAWEGRVTVYFLFLRHYLTLLHLIQ